MKQLQVASYARVSSDQQAEAGTIDSQLAALGERVVQDGCQLAEELTFIDEGYSGATLIRPALERVRDMAAMGGIDRLYVLSPDRLARKYAYQALLVDELQRAGVAVVFLNREIGKSPEDDLLLQVQGMIAEYERAKMMERSRRGKRYAARSGDVAVLSGAPYGFHYVSKQAGGGQARYEIVPEEAKVVQQIFKWVGLERLSIGEVCRRLQQAGIKPRSGKMTWDRSVIWGMLKNPAYKGMAAFGKTRIGPMRPRLRPQRNGSRQPRRPIYVQDQPPEEWIYIPVPALVDADLFAAVQEQLAENRQRARQGKRGASYLLQGLLVCDQCGYAYYGKRVSNSTAKGKKRRYAYYRCLGTDAYRFGGERICDNLQVRTDKLDQLVWDEVCDLLQDGQCLQQEYERRRHTPHQERDELTSAQAQMAKVRQGIARLIDSYTAGYIEKLEFEPRITRFRQRLSDLEQKAQEITDVLVLQEELRLVISRLEDFATQVKGSLAEADWHTRRDLIRTLVKQVEIGKEEVNVVFRAPPDPLDLGPDNESLQLCRKRIESTARQHLLERARCLHGN
jgi:site-specific DNA recombinase